MTSASVVLREWRESDLEALSRLRNDFELQALLMSRPRPNSRERVRAWLVARGAQEDAVFFVMSRGEDGDALGYVQVTGIDALNGCGDLGICLSPGAQGQGIASAACELLEAYLRTTFGLRKLTLRVLTDNARAIAFYRRAGYREVGVLQRHHRVGNDFRDVMIMERHFA